METIKSRRQLIEWYAYLMKLDCLLMKHYPEEIPREEIDEAKKEWS